MDNYRKWIVKPQNYFIKYFDKDIGFIISNGLYYGIMDMQGKLIIKPQYDAIYKFSNKLYKISIKDKIGIINEKGETILEPKFDYTNTDDYPFKFKQGTRYGFLDEKANVLFEINFAYENYFNNISTLADKYWLVEKEGKYQIFNMKDNKVTSNLSFDFIQEYKNFIIASINNKIGIMDKDLNWLILPKFEEFKEFGKNYYKIVLDNKIGLLDNNLRTILEPKFDYIDEKFNNGFVKIRFNDKYGFISEKGEIIEPQFDKIWNFENNIAKVLINQEIKFINTKGEFVE